MPTRTPIALAAALCTLAALPATASAARTTYYSVQAEGTGSYKLDVDFSDEDSVETRTVDASFAWKASIPSVAFRDGHFAGVVTPPQAPTAITGTLKAGVKVIDKNRPGSAVIVDCEGAEAADANPGADVMRAGEGNTLELLPFEHVDFTDHHCSNGYKGSFGIFDQDGDPHALWVSPTGLDPFVQAFELPAEAIGSGKIIQLVGPQPGQVVPSECPGYAQVPGERCSSNLEWSGSVTFTKIGEQVTAPPARPPVPAPGEGDDDLIAPLVPPKPPAPTDDGDDLIAPLVPAKDAIPEGDDDLIAPLVPAKASVNARGSKVSFRAGCSAGCTGTATLTAGATGRGARAAARRRALATLRFKVPAGSPRTIRLALPAKARRHLRRHRRATLAITLRPKTGAARRIAIQVGLPRR